MKNMTTDELLTGIQSQDPAVRTEAWLSAGSVGAPAVSGLAKLAVDGDLEVSRAAKRAIWKIVRTVGAPEGAGQRGSVVKELLKLLDNSQPPLLRRDAIWMLSEIGSDNAEVDAVADLLSNADLREDARCALERIPGERSLAALKKGHSAAPPEFKPSIAHSLRARGG